MNSADDLFREDMGGDIHQDNPVRNMNRYENGQPHDFH